jgi:hypothetical protein
MERRLELKAELTRRDMKYRELAALLRERGFDVGEFHIASLVAGEAHLRDFSRGGESVNKSDIITAIASLPEGDTRLRAVAACMAGQEADTYLSLSEVTRQLGYRTPSALWRLGIRSVGRRITPGGRLKYRLSEVLDYLQSDEAARHRDKLRRQRGQKRGKQ